MDCTEFVGRLEGARKSRKGWKARCPAHDDRQASLAVDAGDDGRILVHCHAGCEPAAIVTALGLALADLAGKASPAERSNGKGGSGSAPRIVATYNYADEKGLVYQVVRFEPKGFRQRRPTAGGGWTWNLDGVQRILYRLPELLAADKALTVYIVEGEKDADALAALGLVATTNAGGAGKWLETYSEGLIGRHVVVLPDNDEPGRKHGAHVAGALAGKTASVRIVELPGLPPKGDVSDWLAAGGSAHALRALVEAASAWESPKGIVPAAKPKRVEPPMAWRPFPVDVLPDVVGNFAAGSSAAIGCDVALVATPMLATLAGAVGNARRLALTDDWHVPCIVWAAIVAESGQHKTPALKAAVWPLDAIQDKAAEAYQAALAEYEAEAARHEAAVRGLKRGDDRPAAPERPRMARCVAQDTTIEALGRVLGQNPRGVLVWRDELRTWVDSHDAYRSGGRGGDAAKWLSAFEGVSWLIDRRGDAEPTYIRRASVSVTGGIQPGILRRAFGRERFEDGTVARLLLAMPAPRPLRWSGRSTPAAVKAGYAEVVKRLRWLPMTGIGDAVEPVDVPLTPQATGVWAEWFNARGEEQARLIGDDAAAGAKLLSYGARLALVLHLVRAVMDDADPNAVDAESIRAGTALADWYRHEGRRLYATLRETDEEANRRRALEVVRRLGGRVKARDLSRHCRDYALAEDAESALAALAGAGWGVWEPVPAGPQGGQPTREFVLTDGVDVDRTSENAGMAGVVSTSTVDEGAFDGPGDGLVVDGLALDADGWEVGEV